MPCRNCLRWPRNRIVTSWSPAGQETSEHRFEPDQRNARVDGRAHRPICGWYGRAVEEPPAEFNDRAGGAGAGQPRQTAFLSRGVASVGLASFFSDAGHEITTSVLPSFVTGVLRGSAGALGLIEGISDAILGMATLFGGMLSNDERRRVALARGGYLSMAAATGAIGASVALWQVAMLRAASWFARGLRSPARDSILTSLAPKEAYGRAFGIERAGDNLGAVVGPLAAAGLVAWLGVRPTLYVAAVPTLFAALAITVAASEARKVGGPIRRRVSLELRGLREAGLIAPMLPVAMFEIANVSSTLLILRSTDLLHRDGRTLAAATSLAVLIYAGHNAVAAGVAFAGGRWIDQIGPRTVFATGAGLYVVAYAAFALPLHAWPALLAAFSLAGSGIGLAEAAESTVVARLLPDSLRGSGFGVLGALQSFGGFASSAVVGLLWSVVSPEVGFFYAAGWMLLAALTAARSRLMRQQEAIR
jgi:MFS family permease